MWKCERNKVSRLVYEHYEENNVIYFMHSLDSNSITSKGAIVLFDTLKIQQSHVVGMNISQNLVDDRCMTALGEFLHSNQHIKNIIIGKTQLSDKGIEVLSNFVSEATSLTKLSFQFNKEITDGSIPSLLRMIKTSNLEEVLVSETSLANIKILERALKIKRVLKSKVNQLDLQNT